MMCRCGWPRDFRRKTGFAQNRFFVGNPEGHFRMIHFLLNISKPVLLIPPTSYHMKCRVGLGISDKKTGFAQNRFFVGNPEGHFRMIHFLLNITKPVL